MTEVVWMSDTQLFAAPYGDETVAAARRYISDMNFTAVDVKIVHRGDQILVIARRDVGQRSNDSIKDPAGNR